MMNLRSYFILILLTASTLITAQRTLTILPSDVDVFNDAKINIFHMKRDLKKAVMAEQPDSLRERYRFIVDQTIQRVVSEQDVEIDYVSSEESVPEELRPSVYRFSYTVFDAEMRRREALKTNRFSTTGGLGRGQTHKKLRQANEEKLKALAEELNAYFNSRYFLLLRFHGQNKPRKKETSPDIVGGVKYQVALVDAQTGEMVYYKSTEQGRKQETGYSPNKAITINPVVKISPKMVDRKIETMLEGAFRKHRSLAKAMMKRGN